MTSPRGRMFWEARACDVPLLPPDDDGLAVVPLLLPPLPPPPDLVEGVVPEVVGFGAFPLGAVGACA